MIATKLTGLFCRLHDDENGDIPVGPILVIGLIVIPLVIALVVFGDALLTWFETKWSGMTKTGVKQGSF